MNAAKGLEKLKRHEAELQKDRENLKVTLAAARTAYSDYEAKVDTIFWEAERTGNTKQADQAEAKLARLSLDVKRKEGALKDCDKAIAGVREKIGNAEAPPLRERLAVVIAEADKIGRKEALNGEDWGRLFDLWTEGCWLIGEIMRLTGKEGETSPFADPRLAFARYAYGMCESLGWGVVYLEMARGIPSAPSPHAALFGEQAEFLHSETKEKSSHLFSLSALIGGIGA